MTDNTKIINPNLRAAIVVTLVSFLLSCSHENQEDNSCTDQEIAISNDFRSTLSEVNSNLESDLNYTYLQFDLCHIQLSTGKRQISDTTYFNFAYQLREDSDSIQDFVYSHLASKSSDFLALEHEIDSYQKNIDAILLYLDNKMEFETNARLDMVEKFKSLDVTKLSQSDDTALQIENELMRNKLLSIEQVCAQLILIQLGKSAL